MIGAFAPNLLRGQQASAARPRVLFIGNSFTYGGGSAVRFYRASSVVDLNDEGIGGVPALFKVFADQAGLAYDVSLETRGGSGLEYHIEQKQREIGSQAWDAVVVQGQSTLDLARPGDPAKLVRTTRQLAELLRVGHPDVAIYLMATWTRADLTYRPGSPWSGQPVEAMARDVRAGYSLAAAGVPSIRAVIPVGEAWARAMQSGVADANPYDGVQDGQVDLWTHDHYHASTYGYYLEALVVFGALTGRDPRALGDVECAAFELGLSRAQARALQQVAFDELVSAGMVTAAPRDVPASAAPDRCARP